MNIEKIYKTHELIKKELIRQGFTKNKTTYQKNYPLSNNFSVTFTITNKTTKIKVYDNDLEEEYLPFYVEDNKGEYVAQIREEVKDIWQEIVKNCFQPISIKDKIFSYVYKKYKTKPDYPFEKDNTSATLKNNNNKWYGIIMEIPYKRLKIDKPGEVLIINLKNKEEKVKELIDNKTYFEAYHMNKKYWYTITLTKNINLEKIYKLIDESYNLVNNKKKS